MRIPRSLSFNAADHRVADHRIDRLVSRSPFVHASDDANGRVAIGQVGRADHRGQIGPDVGEQRTAAWRRPARRPACQTHRALRWRRAGSSSRAAVRSAVRTSAGHRPGADRERSLRKCRVRGDSVPDLDHQTDVLTSDDLLHQENVQLRRHRFELHLIVGVGDQRRERHGRFGIGGVLQQSKRTETNRSIRTAQFLHDLLEAHLCAEPSRRQDEWDRQARTWLVGLAGPVRTAQARRGSIERGFSYQHPSPRSTRHP